jgi:hypothetical protein
VRRKNYVPPGVPAVPAPAPVPAQATHGLDNVDKKYLCVYICSCNSNPKTGANGQSLKQQCVSNHLKQADARVGHQNWYKAEVTYDMVATPPAPFMESKVPTEVRYLWPGWQQQLWPKGRPAYKPGRGMTRRPDVIIVKDRKIPPVQSNIKQVVELKFPGDRYGLGQLEDYIAIAGHDTKMVSLRVDNCAGSPSLTIAARAQQTRQVSAALAMIYAAVQR